MLPSVGARFCISYPFAPACGPFRPRRALAREPAAVECEACRRTAVWAAVPPARLATRCGALAAEVFTGVSCEKLVLCSEKAAPAAAVPAAACT